MCVLIFSATFVWNISHSEKNWASCDNKFIIVLMLSPSYSSQILMKHEFSRKIFEKYSNIKFHENPASGSLIFPCGETGRHDEANSRFS